MRKSICAAITALCVLFFTGCDVNDMSSLREISRPYVGEYNCEILTLGGEEMLHHFKYVKLNLSYKGEFTLSYCDKGGMKGEYAGTYSLGEDGITFTSQNGTVRESRTFPYEKGVISVQIALGEKLLLAEFTT